MATAAGCQWPAPLSGGYAAGINGGITKRLLPAVATYSALYIGICLLLLGLVLASAQWRMAVKLYAGTLAVSVGIALASKLAGDTVWAYRLIRQILDFVVRPLPVAGLYVLFRAGFSLKPIPALRLHHLRSQRDAAPRPVDDEHEPGRSPYHRQHPGLARPLRRSLPRQPQQRQHHGG